MEIWLLFFHWFHDLFLFCFATHVFSHSFYFIICAISVLFYLILFFVLWSQVQDFRFLCPNGTAFDQEAQTCADFGDVDCQQATLFYGSDNFDIYRLDSGFDSIKRPTPPATEDESTFHLQRAESSKSLLFRFIFKWFTWLLL